MSVVFTLGIVIIVIQLMQNTRLKSRIKILETRDIERLSEIKQITKMLVKYGKATEKTESKETKKGRGNDAG